jgi:hypothetical protein
MVPVRLSGRVGETASCMSRHRRFTVVGLLFAFSSAGQLPRRFHVHARTASAWRTPRVVRRQYLTAEHLPGGACAVIAASANDRFRWRRAGPNCVDRSPDGARPRWRAAGGRMGVCIPSRVRRRRNLSRLARVVDPKMSTRTSSGWRAPRCSWRAVRWSLQWFDDIHLVSASAAGVSGVFLPAGEAWRSALRADSTIARTAATSYTIANRNILAAPRSTSDHRRDVHAVRRRSRTASRCAIGSDGAHVTGSGARQNVQFPRLWVVGGQTAVTRLSQTVADARSAVRARSS